jgi:hypothetical protein
MSGRVRRILGGFSTLKELISGMWNGPFWWLLPVLLFLVPIALLFVFLHAAPYVAPFVYTVL